MPSYYPVPSYYWVIEEREVPEVKTLPSRRLALIRLGLLGTILAGCAIALVLVGLDGLRDALEAASDSRWGAVGFVAVYVALVLAFAPGTFITVTSAALFGFTTGLAVTLTGAAIGCSLTYVISRRLGREGMVALLGERLSRIDDFVGEREFVSVLVLRMMPIMPFNIVNYGIGLTRVRFSRYFLATVIGMAPGSTLTTFTVSRASEPGSTGFLVGIGLTVVTIGVSIIVARRISSRSSVDAGPQRRSEQQKRWQ